jgi:glycosyltransferase involved in cell wall biosynthesis
VSAVPGGREIELSVVVPVYACATCLHALHERLSATLAAMGVEYELIFVDDRAVDGSWDVLQQLAAADPRIRAYRLSRNFGQHVAITAGLAQTSGARIVVMDCDLQDPPEEIPNLYAKAREGYDIVFARRMSRPGSRVRRAAAQLYFRLLNGIAGTEIDRSYGTLSMISRKVVDAYLEFRDRDRHYLFILYWLGFNHASIEFPYADRHSGRSAYGLRTLMRHAVDGLVFQTTVVLRWIVCAGFALAGSGALLAAYFVLIHLGGSTPPGWTSLAIFVLVLSGFVITSSGVVGLYVGKIFEQVKGRPLYVLDAVVGGSVGAAPAGPPAAEASPPSEQVAQ